MRKPIALADRLSLHSLRLLAAANLLFLLSFLVAALVATGEARAAGPACTGKDLLADLAKSDPAAMARIEAEAAATPNGEGLLWKIEKDGVAPSWLFGTMHLTDPRVIDLTAPARAAFEASGTVVIESVEVLDQAAMMQAMMKRPDLMVFTDGTTLSSLLPPEDAAVLNAALDARGIPSASVQTMKPWMLAAAISLPACEMARKAGGAPFLDIKLAQDAKAAGKTLAGLETVVSQFEAMASLPMAFHVDGLLSTLKLGSRMDDLFESMIVLYERGDIGTVWPLFHAVLPGGEEDGYAAFEETMIVTRNRGMAAGARPMIEAGGAFIAVGALHLPGENGMVELLRKDGYRVTPGG